RAQYDLDQTMMRAPGDGYVRALTLKGDGNPLEIGDSFILADATPLVGIFSQNGFQTIKPRARIQFALSTILAIFTHRDRRDRERHRARPDRLVLEVGAGPSLPLTSGRNPIVPSAPAARHVSGTATLYAPTQLPWIRSDWTSAPWQGAHFVASARRKASIFF